MIDQSNNMFMIYIIYIHLINVDNLLSDLIVLMKQQLLLFIRIISFEVKVNLLFFVIIFYSLIFLSVEKRVQEPELIEEIDTVSQFGTQVHLKCANPDATIFYTLNGALPTRRYDNVYVKNKFFRFN